tara:strand:- start:241 stop:453 length:213 start_codon:yes stop_codon:yes gene_type:complete
MIKNLKDLLYLVYLFFKKDIKIYAYSELSVLESDEELDETNNNCNIDVVFDVLEGNTYEVNVREWFKKND